MYSIKDDTLYTHCYMAADMKIQIGQTLVKIDQKTAYPEDGRVVLTIGSDASFRLALHIPAWCKNPEIQVNGETYPVQPVKGYATLPMTEWNAGNIIELNLPMEVRLQEGNPEVVDTCGRIAVSRGPVVYCAEGVDNLESLLRDIRISPRCSSS